MRRAHYRPNATDVGKRNQQSSFSFHAAKLPHRLRFVLAYRRGMTMIPQERRKMLLGICQQQRQKPFRLTGGQIPKIRRAFGQGVHKRADDRLLGKQTFEGFGVCRRYIGQPGRYAGPRDVRVAQPRGGRNQVSKCSTFSGGCMVGFAGFLLRGRLTSCGAPHPEICTGPRRGNAMILFRPGLLSANTSSPPCKRATAAARLSPSPEPGCERLCSSRTKRSTTRSRSLSGIPGPQSVTVRRIRSPSVSARTTISAATPFTVPSVAPAYLIELSTRLASA